MPLQAGSWLMSIFAALGAAPSNFTLPFTVATVAGSIGVAAGAGAACCSAVVLLDCSVFLLHAAVSNNPHSAREPTENFQAIFVFMMSPFLVVEKCVTDFKQIYYLDPPLTACDCIAA